MLTVRQAAEKARVCEAVGRGWVGDGLLPYYRVGAKGKRGKILIDPADLDALLASFKVPAAEPGRTAPAGVRTPVPPLKHLRVR